MSNTGSHAGNVRPPQRHSLNADLFDEEDTAPLYPPKERYFSSASPKLGSRGGGVVSPPHVSLSDGGEGVGDSEINDPALPGPSKWTCKRILLAIPVLLSSVGLVAFSVLQQVSFKRLGYSLGPYPYFILLTVSFAFVPIFFAVLWYIHCRSGGFLPEITHWKFKVHFFIIGLMNALNGVFVIFSNPHVPGVLQAIIGQAMIPMVMSLAFFFLRSRFSLFQILGALVIIGGLITDMVPSLFLDNDAHGPPTSVFWTLMFFVGQIPNAIGSVYQEWAFAKAPLNVVYMLAWSNLGQFIFLVILAPLNFIPVFGGITPETFVDNFKNAALCTGNALPGNPECSNAGLMLFFAMGTMLLSGVFQSLLVKYGSASLYVVVSTLITPLAALAFTFSFLMGDHTEKMSPFSWGALAILVVGVMMYRFADKIQAVLSCRREPRLSPSASLPLEPESSESAEELDELPHKYSSTPLPHRKQYGTHERQHRRMLPGQSREAGSSPHAPPAIISNRVGIISSEYSCAKRDPRGLLFEHTNLPIPTRSTRGAPSSSMEGRHLLATSL